MDVQFVAYWLNGDGTQELLHPDLPLSKPQVTRDLGVGRLTGTLPPEMARMRNHSGRLVVQEWATAIYVMVDGLVFDAFIVESISDSDTTVTIDCVGWLGFLRGMPYTGTMSLNNVSVETVVNSLLSSVRRGWSGADIGLYPRFYGSFPLLGVPDPDDLPRIPGLPQKPKAFTQKQPVSPKRPTAPKKGNMTDKQYKAARKAYEAALKRYDKARKDYQNDLKTWRERRDAARKAEQAYKTKVRERESAIKERKRVLESAAYKINWWSTHDTLREIQSVLGDVGGQARVVHTLAESGAATHTLELFGVRRRRLSGVEFIDGENVMKRPRLTRGGIDQAKTVVTLGSGEGSKMVRQSVSVPAGGANGLRRVVVHADKSIRNPVRAGRAASDLLSRRRRVWEYETLTVIDSGLAPIRVFDVGDEVMYRTLDRRGLEVEAWVLVVEIGLDTEQGVMNVSVVPAGEVQT